LRLDVEILVKAVSSRGRGCLSVFLAFAVGVGNFASRRTSMEDCVKATNQKLSLLDSRTRIADWYYGTGNFVVRATDNDRLRVADELSLSLGAPCAVLRVDELDAHVAAAKKAVTPPSELGFRWTRGIAFWVNGKPRAVTLKPTVHGVFFPINWYTVGAFKKDKLAEGKETLDKENRGGGWGAISADIAKEVGGTWTSRAIERVEGVLTKARRFSG